MQMLSDSPFFGVRRVGRESDYSSWSGIEFKNEFSCISTSPVCCLVVQMDNLLHCTFNILLTNKFGVSPLAPVVPTGTPEMTGTTPATVPPPTELSNTGTPM